MTHPCYLYPYLCWRDWQWSRLLLDQWCHPEYGRWRNHTRADITRKWLTHQETPNMLCVARRMRQSALDGLPTP